MAKKVGRPSNHEKSKTLLGNKIGVVLDGKNRAEKSAIMGVSGESVRSYLAGDTVPDARALAALADATGVDFTSADAYAPSNTELTTLAIRADGSNIKTIINGSTVDTGVAYDGTISAGNNIISLGWISGSTINHNYAYTLGLLWNGTALTDSEIELLDQRIRLWN